MISCTEFIPSYSELFSYLEDNYGRAEVDAFWKYLFVPDGKGIPLISFVEKEGIRGCWSYWAGTLNEEAADFTMWLNEKRGFYYSVMRKCPSKGRLLQMKDEIGITPYHDYCLHCDSYRSAVEKVGLKYIYNFEGIDEAACSMLIYDPKIFDGRVIIDEDTLVMDRKASDNEYFHPDFHSSLNMGIDYVAKEHGETALRAFLTRYTENVYGKTIAAVKERGLPALAAMIRDTYEKEKALDLMTTALTGDTLTVTVAECPGVKHLRKTGREVSAWYGCTTEMVMQTIADRCGLNFVMIRYDEETGAAQYRFEK